MPTLLWFALSVVIGYGVARVEDVLWTWYGPSPRGKNWRADLKQQQRKARALEKYER